MHRMLPISALVLPFFTQSIISVSRSLSPRSSLSARRWLRQEQRTILHETAAGALPGARQCQDKAVEFPSRERGIVEFVLRAKNNVKAVMMSAFVADAMQKRGAHALQSSPKGTCRSAVCTNNTEFQPMPRFANASVHGILPSSTQRL